jgi:hypothetical protein
MTYESAAAALTERIEALASALHAAGVPPERSAELIAAAANAAARALTLHALLDQPSRPPAAPVAQAPEPRLPAAA